MYKIEEIPLFAKLTPKNLEIVKDNLFIKEYKKNSIVFYEGEKGNSLYIVLEGRVKLYKTTPKGNHININILKAPSLVGEFACFEEAPFPATCEFQSDGVMGKISFDIIKKLLCYEDVALAIIKSLTAKVMLLSALVHKETVYSSEAKVADILINNIDVFGRLKHSEIADILNMTPETLSRILSKFKKEKIIAVNKNEVKILQLDALKEILEHNQIKECTNCIAKFKAQLGI